MNSTALMQQFASIQGFFEQNPLIFALFLAWTFYWKGMALWKAARLEHQKWFIALLILNTAGILEILYIYIFSKKVGSKKEQAPSA